MEASAAGGPATHAVTLENREDYTILRVQRDHESELFNIRHDSQLHNIVMEEYCKRTGMGDYHAIRFTFDGERVLSNQTPAELETEDGDIVDAWSEQLGGARLFAALTLGFLGDQSPTT